MPTSDTAVNEGYYNASPECMGVYNEVLGILYEKVPVTVCDVPLTDSVSHQIDAIREWGRVVWSSWTRYHADHETRMGSYRNFSRLRNLAKRVGSSRETHQKFFDDQ